MRAGNVITAFGVPVRTIDPLAVGMDLSGYGYPRVFVNDQVEQQKLQALGWKYLRIDLVYSRPGDPTSKIVYSRWTGDQWVQAITAIGAEPLVIVPACPADAAQMVRHFNREAQMAVHYWVVGNEPDPQGIDAASYSRTFNQVYDAMKAIDGSIQIGGGATAWYDMEPLPIICLHFRSPPLCCRPPEPWPPAFAAERLRERSLCVGATSR